MVDEKDEIDPSKTILLDSNILLYSLTISPLGEAIRDKIKSYIDKKYQVCICEIVGTEVLVHVKKENFNDAIDLLDKILNVSVEKSTLLVAGILHKIYFEDKINESQISIVDRIIAATSLRTGFHILTADCNDFPRPYFKDIDYPLITYKIKGKPIFLTLALLSPNDDAYQLKVHNLKIFSDDKT